jgi:hypothetical protein
MAMFIHILRLHDAPSAILFTQNRFLANQISLYNSLRIFYEDPYNSPLFTILQVCVERDQMDFYIAAFMKNPQINISTTVYPTQQCSYVDQLIQNRTIVKIMDNVYKIISIVFGIFVVSANHVHLDHFVN